MFPKDKSKSLEQTGKNDTKKVACGICVGMTLREMYSNYLLKEDSATKKFQDELGSIDEGLRKVFSQSGLVGLTDPTSINQVKALTVFFTH